MPELLDLYQLHKIDEAIHSLRQQAATLDTGQEELKHVKVLTQEFSEVSAVAKKLAGEQRDLELQQKGFEEKLERLDKKLFDGSIVSPKEIGNIKTEIDSVKSFVDKNDERLLELFDEGPPAQKIADEVQAKLKTAEETVSAKKADAIRLHAEFKVEFDQLKTTRPDVSLKVEDDLLEMYNDIRKHTGDVGMAIVTDAPACDRCGVTVSEKTIELLRMDKLITCEDCRRILIQLEPEA